MRMSGAMRTAIMSLATSAPRRTPMSKRSATMSMKRLSLLTSTLMSGYFGSHGSSRGQTSERTACSVAVMRTVPAGLPRSSPKHGELGLDVGQARAHGAVQALARLGGRHAARGAVEQFQVEPVLQRAHRLAERGLRHADLRGCAREALGAHHGGKGRQVIETGH